MNAFRIHPLPGYRLMFLQRPQQAERLRCHAVNRVCQQRLRPRRTKGVAGTARANILTPQLDSILRRFDDFFIT